MDPRWKVHPETNANPTALAKLAAEWSKAIQFPALGEHHDLDPSHWLGLVLFKSALEGGPPVQVAEWEGNLTVPPKSLLEAFQSIAKARVVRISDRGNGNGHYLLSGETAMIAFRTSAQGTEGSATIATTDEDICRKIEQLLRKALIPDNPAEGVVFSLAQGMAGYSISRVGLAGTPLERSNYTPEVLEAFDHVVAEQGNESPCGRLVILSGEPGTGKTFLVRSLLAQAPKTAYILVPPHLMESLGSPKILPALTQAKREFDGPIMLIIEDADYTLVKRDEKNMNAIAAMLNLGDGILGSILDIRILATTNAQTLEMDPATQRDGRLCRHIEVGALPGAQANAVISRLLGKAASPFQGPTPLAKVYGTARRMGWMPPPKPKRDNGKYARPELI